MKNMKTMLIVLLSGLSMVALADMRPESNRGRRFDGRQSRPSRRSVDKTHVTKQEESLTTREAIARFNVLAFRSALEQFESNPDYRNTVMPYIILRDNIDNAIKENRDDRAIGYAEQVRRVKALRQMRKIIEDRLATRGHVQQEQSAESRPAKRMSRMNKK